jgi:hypothetical protein
MGSAMISGQGASRQRSERNIGSLRPRHPAARQEASSGDEDQEEDAQSALERDLLLRGFPHTEATE